MRRTLVPVFPGLDEVGWGSVSLLGFPSSCSSLRPAARRGRRSRLRASSRDPMAQGSIWTSSAAATTAGAAGRGGPGPTFPWNAYFYLNAQIPELLIAIDTVQGREPRSATLDFLHQRISSVAGKPIRFTEPEITTARSGAGGAWRIFGSSRPSTETT